MNTPHLETLTEWKSMGDLSSATDFYFHYFSSVCGCCTLVEGGEITQRRKLRHYSKAQGH